MQRSRKKRVLTWTLVGLGVATLALGAVLMFTMPPPGAYAGHVPFFGRMMERGSGPWAGPGPAPGATNDGKTPEATPGTPGNPPYNQQGDGRELNRRGPRGFGPGPGFGPGQGFGGMPGFGRMAGPMGGAGHGPGMLIIGLLLLFVIIAVARRGMHRHGPWAGPGREEDALSWLRREYAEGKISEEEYKKRLSVLKE